MTATPARPRDPLLLLVVLSVVLLPLVPADLNSPTRHGAKTLAFELTAALLLGLLPWLPRRRAPDETCAPHPTPLLFLFLLTLWASVSLAVSPHPDFAFYAWWLLAGGLVVAYAVATRARTDADLLLLLDALTLAGAVLSLCAFALYPSGGMRVAEGTYHDHQLLGAALMILMPLSLTALTLPASPTRRSLATGAFALCAMGLMLAQDRSAWIGASVALLVFGTLSLQTLRSLPKPGGARGQSAGRRLQALIPAVLILIALGYFFVASQQSGLLRGRAHTLTTALLTGRDESLQWRLNAWQAALRMTQRKPVFGWGVGGYPLYEQLFTGQGDSEQAVASGAGHIGDETHNSYLQLAVELGLPGLALWLLALGSVLRDGFRALRHFPGGSLRPRILIGGLSALAGQAVDACADPAWQFGEVALYLWVILGLVIAASGGPTGVTIPGKVRLPLRIAVSAFSIWVVFRLIATAHTLPIPHL